MITLYGRAASRASRTLWTLEEIGVPYQHVPYDFQKGETRTAEYLAINPAAKIPALTDGEVVMTESLAMNMYLAQTYSAGVLWPDAPAERARCLQWTLWTATELEPLAIGRLIESRKPSPDPKVLGTLTEKTKPVFDVLTAALRKAPFLAGHRFTIADLNAASVAEYLVRTKFDMSQWVQADAWLQVCLSRPANQKVDAIKAAA